MITLRSRLYESLLDDEEDLVKDDTSILLNGPDSLVQKTYLSKPHTWMKSNSDPKLEKNTLVYPCDVLIKNNSNSNLKKLIGVDKIDAETIYLDDKMVNYDGNEYCKKFSIDDISINANVKSISNVDFKFKNKSRDYDYRNIFMGANLNDMTRFSFSNVTFTGKRILIISRRNKFPEFKNVTFKIKSGAEIEYDPSGFGYDKNNSFTKEFNSCLDPAYQCKVFDHSTGQYINRPNNIKAIIATLKDLKYEVESDVMKFKPGTTIHDIFGTTVPDEFEVIWIPGWMFDLYFYKPGYDINSRMRVRHEFAKLNDRWLVAIDVHRVQNRKYISKHKKEID